MILMTQHDFPKGEGALSILRIINDVGVGNLFCPQIFQLNLGRANGRVPACRGRDDEDVVRAHFQAARRNQFWRAASRYNEMHGRTSDEVTPR